MKSIFLKKKENVEGGLFGTRKEPEREMGAAKEYNLGMDMIKVHYIHA
jgi:hypothetical protein